jgi:hypothetical protein
MTSEELATQVDQMIEECRERVMGVGHDQYSVGNKQRFEIMLLDDLFEYAEEELRDLVIYACMLRIRLRKLRNEIQVLQARPMSDILRIKTDV